MQYVLLVPTSLQFKPRFTSLVLGVTHAGHFETCALNDIKIAPNLRKRDVPPMCY